MDDKIETVRLPRHPKAQRPIWALAIAHQRKRLNLSQAALGERLGASQTTVASWETGQNQPSLDTLGRIADALGLSVSNLLGQTGSAKIPFPKKGEDDQPFFDQLAEDVELGVKLHEQMQQDFHFKAIFDPGVASEYAFGKSGMWQTLYGSALRSFRKARKRGMEPKAAQNWAIDDAMDRFRVVAIALIKEGPEQNNV